MSGPEASQVDGVEEERAARSCGAVGDGGGYDFLHFW